MIAFILQCKHQPSDASKEPDLSEIEVNYISAGGQLVAMYVVEDGVGSYYYPHQDHLGSIIHITDANGDIVYTQSFDAWGRTRNPSDLSYDNIPDRPDWLWRGYTGHEHLDEFGLINMNGRLYDPVVGRMLSPDNYVQNPDFSQSYNRYSYVWNNPLKYNDPTGEVIPFIAVVAIVGVVSGGINLAVNWNSVENPGDALYYFGVGAAVGAAATVGGAALAPVIGTGAIAGAALGAGAGFTSSYLNTGYATGEWGGTALEAGAIGAVYGAVGGAVIAGTAAGLSGNNVWTGAPKGPQGLFSFKGGEGGPSFKFSDAHKIGKSDFWKYGRNIHSKVEPGPATMSKTQIDGEWDFNYSREMYNSRVVKNPDGVSIPIDIPENYIAMPAENGNGIVFRPPNTVGDANIIRVMGPTNYAPNGYAVFHNSYGQPYNPANGMTLSRSNWHFLFP